VNKYLLIAGLLLALGLTGCDKPAQEQAKPADTPSQPASTETRQEDDNAAPTAEEIAALAEADKAEDVAKPLSIMLLYDVDEPGVDPYQSRMIITEDFIRLDEKNDTNDFVLVDRKKRIVYSVSSDNDAILVVNSAPVKVESPIELKLDMSRTMAEGAPTIDGHILAQYVFIVNNETCQDAMIAEGLLPEATKALSEYRHILSGQHSSTMQHTPADTHNGCDLSMHIFQPDRHLQFGLPINERDRSGYQRSLVDYDDDYEVNTKLFELPGEFGRFTIDDLNAGNPPVTE